MSAASTTGGQTISSFDVFNVFHIFRPVTAVSAEAKKCLIDGITGVGGGVEDDASLSLAMGVVEGRGFGRVGVDR